MARRTAVTVEDGVVVVTRRYSTELGFVPNEEKQAFFRAALENGLTFNELWAAIDYALSVCGYGAHERDYWPHIQQEARRIWLELNKGQAAP